MDESIFLPPGFRFHPTDEEIITHYLFEKIVNRSFKSIAIGEASFNETEPWDLPSKTKMGEKKCYFFCQKDRKYPTGMRTNRATATGYWKTTGKDKEVFKGKGILIGMKKTLVFYRGRAPGGLKTNWVMHEFRLAGKLHQDSLSDVKDEWVVCRVYDKKDSEINTTQDLAVRINPSFVDDLIVETNTLAPPTNSPYFIYPRNKAMEDTQELAVRNEMNQQPMLPESTVMSHFLPDESLQRSSTLNVASFALKDDEKTNHTSNSIFDVSQYTGMSSWNYGFL